MNLASVMGWAGLVDYAALGLVAIWGITCTILFYRQLGRRSFPNSQQSEQFLTDLRSAFELGDFDDAERICGTPANWYRAVPMLTRLALDRRKMSVVKIKEILAAKFEQEVLTRLENLIAWINTAIKTAPMLGLWGTVLGMIGAFSKIAENAHPDPTILAGDIYVALVSTALGLMIAIPLVIVGNFISIKMRALEDETIELVEVVLEDLETAQKRAARTAQAG